MELLTEPNEASNFPAGSIIDLGRRGRAFVRHAPRPGAPTALLLHGWTSTADLNWRTSYGILSRHFGIVAMDLRGHGRGPRCEGAFRLTDCADDAIAVVDQLGLSDVMVVGYSMGGAVAQLVAQRAGDRVNGLVLCSSAARVGGGRQARRWGAELAAAAALARCTPRWLRDKIGLAAMRSSQDEQWRAWALDQLAGHDWLRVVQAGRAILRFDARAWLGQLDVPVALLATMEDRVVPPVNQLAVRDLVPDAHVITLDADHAVCLNEPAMFAERLVEACSAVADRASRAASAARTARSLRTRFAAA